MRKFVLCLTLLSIFGGSFAAVTGGIKQVVGRDLDNLTKAVSELIRKNNCDTLKLIRIYTATHQTEAGSKYEINAELKEKRKQEDEMKSIVEPVNCTILLWEKPWIPEFIRMDIECGDGDEEKRKYSLAVGVDADRRKRQIGDGFSAIDRVSLDNYFADSNVVADIQHSDFDVVLKRVVKQ